MPKPVITFVIPVRHPANASNWQQLKQRLAETVKSISAQDCPDWNGVIVANHGADLPELPPQFEVARVDFPPNEIFEQGTNSQEVFRNAVRDDKGRRILAGLLQMRPTGHVMIVDDDDLVSRKLASFVSANPDMNGWFVAQGFIWTEAGRLLYRYDEFNHICGTCLIVRADLYRLPASLETADPAYIRRMLGSHIYLVDELKLAGHPLAKLPFPGAVYRTGHAGAHSRSHGVIRQYLLKKSVLLNPFRALARLRRIRLITDDLKVEFFGKSPVG